MLLLYKKLLLVNCDAPKAWQFGIQDPATPSLEGMISFHSYLMLYIVGVTVFVCWMLLQTIKLFNKAGSEKSISAPYIFTHSSALEIIWTILPAFILILIAIPSFTLLYSLDEYVCPTLTIKIIGHQWYWSYEFSLPSKFQYLTQSISWDYDSYMVPTDELKRSNFRLLEVDKRMVMPVKRHIRLLVTAADVLHSWTIPSFGVKVDACPGRLSEAYLYIKRKGLYYGQCSEICGINHGFMPISVRVVSAKQYYEWYFARVFKNNILKID